MVARALPDVSRTLEHADEAAHAAAERLATAGQQLRSQASTARDEVRERVDGLRDLVEEVDIEPAVRRARIGVWQVVRSLAGAVAALARLAPRGLAALSSVVDEASERGAEVSERARELATAVPPSRRDRRRRRLRTAAWAGGGFGVGLGVGWFLARRSVSPGAQDIEQQAAGEDAVGEVSHNGPVTTSAATGDPGRGA